VIQALKAIGKDRVTDANVATIRKALTAQERKTLLVESRGTTSWIYETIKTIAKEGVDE
jgi:hypothetical protein